MKTLPILLLGLFTLHTLQSQNCSQKLDDAKRAYYNGQFREVATTLEGCLDQLSQAEQTEAYKLLTDTYLVLGETEQADQYIKQLLSLDPFYRQRESDLVEFKNLFNSYKILSKYSLGLTGSILRPDYRIIKHQSISGITEEPRDFDEIPGYQVGLTGDIALYKDLFLNAAVIYEKRGFSQSEVISDNFQTIKSTERAYRLIIPIQLKYIYQKGKYKPFVSGGYSYHRLLKAEADLLHFPLEPVIFGQNTGVAYLQDDYDITDLRRLTTSNWIVGTGVQAPIRGNYLLEIKISYERGLHNLIEEENRYADPVLIHDFAYVPDDFKVSAWIFSVSIMRNFTKPEKK